MSAPVINFLVTISFSLLAVLLCLGVRNSIDTGSVQINFLKGSFGSLLRQGLTLQNSAISLLSFSFVSIFILYYFKLEISNKFLPFILFTPEILKGRINKLAFINIISIIVFIDYLEVLPIYLVVFHLVFFGFQLTTSDKKGIVLYSFFNVLFFMTLSSQLVFLNMNLIETLGTLTVLVPLFVYLTFNLSKGLPKFYQNRQDHFLWIIYVVLFLIQGAMR